MNKLLILILLLTTCSCGLKGGVERGYIISHSLIDEIEAEETD